jgi:1-acyl-sn-glycerol-3-phosphate acyltransferase
MAVAYEAGVPVQPVALWYSEPIGLAPETPALAGTANMLRYPTQAIVKFAPLLLPADYASADDFAAACEAAVREAYAQVAVDLCSREEGEGATEAAPERAAVSSKKRA